MPASRAVLAAIDELGLNHRKAHKSLRASDHRASVVAQPEEVSVVEVHVKAPEVEAPVVTAPVVEATTEVVEPIKDETQLEFPSAESESASEEKQASSKKKGKKPVTD